MTANDTHQSPPLAGPFARVSGDTLRQAGEWLRRLMIAFAVIVAAGILAVVTAIFGLVLAAVAILMRFAGQGRELRPQHSNTPRDGETITLEARRTPRGWTVE